MSCPVCEGFQAGEREQGTMNKRRRYCAVLLLGTVGLLLTGVCGLWLQSYQRQEALNRQLIAALVMGDTQQALALINAGADPNTPFDPPQSPSLRQLWNYLFHRVPQSVTDKPTAFLMACGAEWRTEEGTTMITLNDDPQLVQVMLQHGVNPNVQYDRGPTALMWAELSYYEKTVRVLLAHGADPNLSEKSGMTALQIAIDFDRSDRSDLIALLKKAGAKK